MPPIKSKITQKKRKRRSITLEVKSKVLSMNSRGLTASIIANQLKLPRTTVQSIVKEKNRITKAIENATNMKLTTIRKQQGLIPEVEKILFIWIQDQTQQRAPLSLALIQNKALSLFNKLKKGEENDSNVEETFGASRGWFTRFKNRYALHNVLVQGEAASADEITAAEFRNTLWQIIQEESLSPKQVFNVDETGLFWKKLPARTFISQEEKSFPGFKTTKDRLTLLLGCNAEGDFKLKPLLVYRSQNPRALQNHNKDSLPVIWKSNPKALVTANLFEEWYKDFFIPAVKGYCAKNDLPYKALLLIDNAPGHPRRIAEIDPQIKVVFLPPNTTALLQPMDQGVTASFKAYYLRKCFLQAVAANDENGVDLKTFWKNFSIMDCVKNFATSWNEINTKGVWMNVCPQFFMETHQENLNSFKTVKEITDDIVTIANNLPGIDIKSGDVTELLASHSQELSNEDLNELEAQTKEDQIPSGSSSIEVKQLTSKLLIEAFNHIQAAMQIFEANDPNFKRSFEVNNNISVAYKCYREIHENRKKEAKRARSEHFFARKT